MKTVAPNVDCETGCSARRGKEPRVDDQRRAPVLQWSLTRHLCNGCYGDADETPSTCTCPASGKLIQP